MNEKCFLEQGLKKKRKEKKKKKTEKEIKRRKQRKTRKGASLAYENAIMDGSFPREPGKRIITEITYWLMNTW